MLQESGHAPIGRGRPELLTASQPAVTGRDLR